MIRFLDAAGLPCAIYAVKVGGRTYSAEEVAAVLGAAQNAAEPMCAGRTHFVGVTFEAQADDTTWICTAYGCDRIRTGSGPYCKMHQQRVRRHGSADVVKPVGRKKTK